MIARFADVCPRVFIDRHATPVRIDAAAADVLERRPQPAVIALVGPPGAGKSAALAHLLAARGAQERPALLDAPSLGALRDAANHGPVIYTRRAPFEAIRNDVVLRLAPWSEDDLIEYLLARHRERCHAVMQRVRAAPDPGRLDGLPALWAPVLDLLAANPTVDDCWTALERVLDRELCNRTVRTRAGKLAVQRLIESTGGASAAPAVDRERSFSPLLQRWLWCEAVQILLAAGFIRDRLLSGRRCPALGQRLPMALIRACGQEASRSGNLRMHLSEILESGRLRYHSTAASILNTSGAAWSPPHDRPLRLDEAILDGVCWARMGLTRLRARKASLNGANLALAEASDADFTDAHLNGARLSGAQARRARFTCADLVCADLTRLDAEGANFDHAVLDGANLEGASLRGASLIGAGLRATRLVRVDLSCATISAADVENADFAAAILEQADLSALKLRRAGLAGAHFRGTVRDHCELAGVELPAADFAGARLARCDLTGARMPNADFSGARVRGCGLAEIDWECVNLCDADLRSSSFHMGSSRSGLVFGPIASEGSRTGFYTDEIDERSYRAPEDIRKANLRGADLRGAAIEGVDFYLVDLRGAKYDGAQERWLRECGAILEAIS